MDVLTFFASILCVAILAGAAILIMLIWKDAYIKTRAMQKKELVKKDVVETKTNEELEKELNENREAVISMDSVIKSANAVMGISSTDDDVKEEAK